MLELRGDETTSDAIQRNSKLSRRMDELNAFYVVLEQKFLASSINLVRMRGGAMRVLSFKCCFCFREALLLLLK